MSMETKTKTVFIKMKPYLKEFILGLEDKDGNKLYGPEPIRFSKKDRICQLIDTLRHKPWPDSIILKPESRKDRGNFLEVVIEPDPVIRFDDLRTYLSAYSQTKIAKYIYNQFCAHVYEYVNQDLIFQKRVLPGETPRKVVAYRNFCNQYHIMSAEEDSIRKAFDRQAKSFTTEHVKKKFDGRENIARFQPQFAGL